MELFFPLSNEAISKVFHHLTVQDVVLHDLIKVFILIIIYFIYYYHLFYGILFLIAFVF